MPVQVLEDAIDLAIQIYADIFERRPHLCQCCLRVFQSSDLTSDLRNIGTIFRIRKLLRVYLGQLMRPLPRTSVQFVCLGWMVEVVDADGLGRLHAPEPEHDGLLFTCSVVSLASKIP